MAFELPVLCSLRLVFVVSSCSSFAHFQSPFQSVCATGCKGRAGGHTPTWLTLANRAKVFRGTAGHGSGLWPRGRGMVPPFKSFSQTVPGRSLQAGYNEDGGGGGPTHIRRLSDRVWLGPSPPLPRGPTPVRPGWAGPETGGPLLGFRASEGCGLPPGETL